MKASIFLAIAVACATGGARAADYNSDGTADVAVFRPATGLWAVRDVTRFYYGSSGDEPVPDDYDGNGQIDPGIFRPPAGLWAIREVTRWYFGSTDDRAASGNGRGGTPGAYAVSFNEFMVVESPGPGDPTPLYKNGRLTLSDVPSAPVIFYAPVHLPDHAILTDIYSYWDDFDPLHNLYIALVQDCVNFSESTFAEAELVNVSSSGGMGYGATTWTGFSDLIRYTGIFGGSGFNYNLRLIFPVGTQTNTGLRTVLFKYLK